VATASAQQAVGIMREEQQTREYRVLKDTGTTRSGRRIVIRACKHFSGRGEGKGEWPFVPR
jgi:hypothetical protein